MISKSLSTSEKFAALAPAAGELAEFCQLLYPLLVIHTDDFGRLQGDVNTVKYVCFPSSPRSPEEFARALQWLHDVHLIVWYVVSGKRYIQIAQFEVHQQGLHKRTRSQFPRAPGAPHDASGKFPEVPDQEKGTEEKGTEGNRREGKYPPTPRALAAHRGARLTRKELKEAEQIRNMRFGCQHTPRCPNAAACVRAIALERRAS